MTWISWADDLDDLGVREAAALASRRWDDLIAIQGERHELIRSLPQPLPPAAKPVLERALATSLATQRALVGPLAETKGMLERIGGGRRAVRAYGGPPRPGLDARA